MFYIIFSLFFIKNFIFVHYRFFIFSYSINVYLFVLFFDTQGLGLNLWLICARLICGLKSISLKLRFKFKIEVPFGEPLLFFSLNNVNNIYCFHPYPFGLLFYPMLMFLKHYLTGNCSFQFLNFHYIFDI